MASHYTSICVSRPTRAICVGYIYTSSITLTPHTQYVPVLLYFVFVKAHVCSLIVLFVGST